MNSTLRLTLALAALSALSQPALAAQDCSTSNCAQASCTTDCNETDFRQAVHNSNQASSSCGGSFTPRTIKFNVASGTACPLTGGTAIVSMAQTSASANGKATCTGDSERYAVCVTGSNITIDGADAGGVPKVTFDYSGANNCENCSGSCCGGAGNCAALFTVKGKSNTLKNFAYKYFPEGIHIRASSGSTSQKVIAVTAPYYCEEALTIDSTAGTGVVVQSSTFTGNNAPEAGRTCWNAGVSGSNCGLDKAIQVNGGTSTIGGSSTTGNTFTKASQPVNIVNGAHTVSWNTVTGDTSEGPGAEEACQALTVERTGSNSHVVTFDNNTVDHCKFGIRAVGKANVVVTNNTMTNNYVSAFQVKKSGTVTGAKLKGENNRMKRNGFYSGSDCSIGALVNKDDTAAKVDFGGGDKGGAVVISPRSTGNNVFCDQNSLNAVFNDSTTCGSGNNAGAVSIGVGRTSGTVATNYSNTFPFNVVDNGGNNVGWNVATASGSQCSF